MTTDQNAGTEKPLIALISAVTAAIAPATDAILAAVPDARVWNILDDRLLQDAGDAGGITPELAARMERLIGHAQREGADGILLTCSMYGPVAEQIAVTSPLPIFAPDSAAFTAIAEGGYSSVLVLSSGDGPLADSVERLEAVLAGRRSPVTITGAVARSAAAAARSGSVSALSAELCAAVKESGAHPDAVFLAQYSLAPASESLEQALRTPVITGPQRAAAAMQAALHHRSNA